MAKEIQLQSGATLSVTPAPFGDAHALLKALMKAAKGLPVTNDLLNADMTVLKDALLSAAVSEEVEAALFKCFQRVSYQGQRVTREAFDTVTPGEQMRGDYYAICWHVIQENCSPFFKQAFSLLRERLKTPDAPQKSPSAVTRP